MTVSAHVAPLLSARGLSKQYAGRGGCVDIDLDVYPGEVLCIVGESGSGKSTLLNALALRTPSNRGTLTYRTRDAGTLDLIGLAEPQRRMLSRTEWGFVHQNARDGLRHGVSAGANIGEPLMAIGARHYGRLRETAADWMARVELDAARIDELPSAFSGGMQQRLQIARNLVTGPRLVFMDEPTAGLDVSVQARLLDLLRTLTSKLHLAALIVTHDIGVARLLAHRLMVMKDGRVVESGLTDQVLDDPQHPYTQTLVASVLPV
ncbi:putative phosphonate transport system ATP-binding protein [Paraburkholderia sp. BL8N3]|jgi:putative phosphonate transport system ATP-binding protein|nr:phosphonate C-P lyase system protein PhnK [Paraburkholderia sp. BL8N3]TCK34748.1 putative phosphonate transport system ATP-binding protein [Paraburkholderia sp. BL8N3]